MGSWFYDLFGEEERCSESEATSEAYEATRALFQLEEDGERGDVLIAPNGRRFHPGRFEAPSLAELRQQVASNLRDLGETTLKVTNIIGNVRELHVQPEAAGAAFQVASQLNTLEFVDSAITPEHGVTRYLFDKSQGPACAQACAASTVWRNYFMPMDSGSTELRGQRSGCQVNCLRDVQSILGEGLVDVHNGYTSSTCLEALSEKVQGLSEEDRDMIRAALHVGVQWDAEVTDQRIEHKKNTESKNWERIGTAVSPVTQIFCSALSMHTLTAESWRPLAQLMLEAAYEATLAVAARNLARGKSHNVYLTQLGGANFHNKPEWIESAIRRALYLYRSSRLHVHIVHFSSSHPQMQAYIRLAAEWGPIVESVEGTGGSNVPEGRSKGKGSVPPKGKSKGNGKVQEGD